jgi:hypothetical protein
MTLVNLPANRAILLVNKGDDPGIIINRDLVNSVVFGEDSAFSSIAASIIDALTFVQYSGDSDVWAAGLNASVTVDIQPNNENWAPSPAQAAASIAASGLALESTQAAQATAIPNNIFGVGVPLYTKNQVIRNDTQVIAGNGSFISPIVAITQIGFELRIRAQFSAANGTTGAFQVTLDWFDSNTGLLIDQDQYIGLVASTTDTSGFALAVKGPTKGDQCRLTVKDLDPQPINYNGLMLANSRTYDGDFLYCPNFTTSSGIVTGDQIGLSADDRVLSSGKNLALPATISDNWIIPPNMGPFSLNVWQQGASAANFTVKGRAYPSTVYSQAGGANWIFNDTLVVGNPNKYYFQGYQNAGPMQLVLTNNGSGNANYTFIYIIGGG